VGKEEENVFLKIYVHFHAHDCLLYQFILDCCRNILVVKVNVNDLQIQNNSSYPNWYSLLRLKSPIQLMVASTFSYLTTKSIFIIASVAQAHNSRHSEDLSRQTR
jgi:hypothetical protein